MLAFNVQDEVILLFLFCAPRNALYFLKRHLPLANRLLFYQIVLQVTDLFCGDKKGPFLEA